MNRCYYCKTKENLRPYGPNNAPVCPDCALATPDRIAESQAAVERLMVQFGPIVAIVRDGPPRAPTDEELKMIGRREIPPGFANLVFRPELLPTPRYCETPGCEGGWLHAPNESGDPRGSAIPATPCSDCLGTGVEHVRCRGCNDVIPWHTAVLVDQDTIDEGYLCFHCRTGANDDAVQD